MQLCFSLTLKAYKLNAQFKHDFQIQSGSHSWVIYTKDSSNVKGNLKYWENPATRFVGDHNLTVFVSLITKSGM